MNKKILSLVLALVMVLGTFTNVFAETKAADKKEEKPAEKVEKIVGKDNKIQYIIDKNFVKGYEDGTYGLDKNIKRAEITRLLVLANGNEELAKKVQGAMSIYTDVDTAHWANGVITVGTTVKSDANGIAMLAGYPDKSFKPEKDVTYAELAKMLVVLAKKDLTEDMVKNAKWASSWMTWAAELGILDDVTVADSNKAANRADAFTMVYNALYKMETFKRVPANEVRGIISDLNSKKLVLNQDSKKEYVINNETVIVTGNNERSQFVWVENINKLGVWKGTLVRVLINDKNEVTHIIALGDPDELARGNKQNTVEPKNNIWKGVAKNTVETYNYGNIKASLTEMTQESINSGHAKVELNGNKTKGSKIAFYNGNDKLITKLNINSDTEIYVANPYNNIMRNVKDINEALSLIGFHNYEGYKIPNVYAGFNDDGYNAAVAGFDNDRNTAKVIVFNVVSKDAGGEKYRLLENADSKFNSLVENTDGKKLNINDVLNKAHYAFNYGDKFDVVERRGDSITTLIDHSNLRAFPIVKVLEIKGNNNIVVKGYADDAETTLYVGNADIFNKGQYKDLKVGDYLQFTVENKNSNVVEELSIFPAKEDTNGKIERAYKDSGSIFNVTTKAIEGNTAIGTLIDVNSKAYPYTATIKVEKANWDKGFAVKTSDFEVSQENAEKLEAYKNESLKFKVDFKKNERRDWAYDFRENNAEKNFPPIKLDKVTLKSVLADIDALNREEVKCDNYKALRTEYDNIEANIKKLDINEQATFEPNKANEAYKTALTTIDTNIKAFEDAKKHLDANLALVTDALIKGANAVSNNDLTPAGILVDAKTKITGLNSAQVDVEVTLANGPTDNGRYAAGAELKLNVKLTSKEKTCLASVEKVITGEIAK